MIPQASVSDPASEHNARGPVYRYIIVIISTICANIWVVVNIMVPFGVRIIIRHLLLRVPQKGAIILTTTHMKASIS